MKKGKLILIGFLIGALLFGGTKVLAELFINSNEVSYTPSDSEWEVSKLDTALDNLYELSQDRLDTIASIANAIYPVGSIYISTSSANPSTLFGGTWEQVEDRFLLAAGSTYTAGSTGGEATHTLTVAEMPSHSHNANVYYNTAVGGNGVYGSNATGTKYTPGSSTVSQGGSQAHNNMPPYIVVYVWKRTA